MWMTYQDFQDNFFFFSIQSCKRVWWRNSSCLRQKSWDVAEKVEIESVDDSVLRADNFTNFYIDEYILEIFSSHGVPLTQ